MNCRTCGLILPVEWGWRSGQSHLNSDATIAREGAGRTPFLSAKGREGARRKPFFVHGGPRRGTENGNGNTFCPRRGRRGAENGNGNTFCPRRGAEGGGERQRQHLLSTEGRGGGRRTATATPFVHGGARRGRENRAIASKFGRHNSPRRAPTRGAPTDSGSLTWVCPNLMQLPWGGGSPAHGGMDLCGVPVACLNWGRADNSLEWRIRAFRSGLGLVA